MRNALGHWRNTGSHLNLANGLFRLAQILAEHGDRAEAKFELDAAEAAFREMDAPARVAACGELGKSLK
jgi:hypothetical protein